ncbi:protein-L-isoaspartate(D-aspartate) O-methyltransferase [Puia sp. P3]|uniref:protein-L-isoaspartate(D-aspartate) O-methyltransferase n=1 Tax=Puia sp. P3 TaxID=3423952 RepID=UPI003D668CD2
MRSTDDSYLHKGLRRQLVEVIRQKGITDERVLDAILHIPRHFFMDSAFDKIAYEDRAFPIGEGQTISQPYTVAYQSQLLEIKPFEKLLEIGTGSAYQAVVLAEMGAQVYTIERQKKLFDSNKQFAYLKKYPGLKLFYGDGYEGLPTYGPFDKIIVTAAAPFIPPKLVQQLKPGGKMVIPVGDGKVQRMLRLTRLADGTTSEEWFDNFSFVPMLGERTARGSRRSSAYSPDPCRSYGVPDLW